MKTNLLESATIVQDDWHKLVPLSSPDIPSLNLKHLPDWVGNYARALSASTETPPELSAGMLLITCATAIARCIKVNVKHGYTEPCNLWVVVALPPGNRKSAIQSAATNPLIKWEKEQSEVIEQQVQQLTSERKSMEARAKEIRKCYAKEKDDNKASELAESAAQLESEFPEIPIPPQLWTSDATPERLGSLLADQDECIAWLSSEGGVFDLLQGRYSNGIPNLDLVLKAHSGDSERVDRGSRPPVFLCYPLLSIGLSPQPAVLQGLASKPGFRGRGLLARFLYLLPPSPLGYRKLETVPIPDKVSDDYESGIRAMLNWEKDINELGEKEHHQLQLSPEAYLEWHDFAKAIEVKMRPGGNLEHFTDWAGKAPGAAVRLAGVLHSIKHAHGFPWESVITKETMIDALEIMAIITHHSLAALDLMGTDPILAKARLVWEWIERGRHEVFIVRDAFNKLRGSFPRVKNLTDVLAVLEERGYLQVLKPETDGAGRPPSPTVIIRQQILDSWS